MSLQNPTPTEDKALSLLGSGATAEQTANALGIEPSRISQLLSNEVFAAQVEELRYQNLQQHNVRDNAYDALEDALLEKIRTRLDLVIRPMELTKILQVINNAKRRGQSAPEQIINQQNIVSLSMPTQIINQFTTNINNQVIKAGDQELLTIPSTQLLNKVEGTSNEAAAENQIIKSENILK